MVCEGLQNKPDTRFRGLRKDLHVCVGAKVLILTNILVADGLMNGALGTVVDFVYDTAEINSVSNNANINTHPKYIVVHVPQTLTNLACHSP